MKSLVFVLALGASLSAQAYEGFFQCNVNAVAKSNGLTLERTMILSEKRSSKTVLPEPWKTELNLVFNVKTNQVEGTVNGQRNFILKPSATYDTSFESASAKGEIVCEYLGGEVSAFIFKPHGAIYITELKSVNALYNAESVPYSCYIGHVEDAKLAVAETLKDVDANLISIDSDKNIVVGKVGRDCLESRGSYDDYECTKVSEPYLRKYKMATCDPESHDPR